MCDDIKIGQRFGSRVIISKAYVKRRIQFYNVLCDCGSLSTVSGYALRSGKSRRCNKCKSKSIKCKYPNKKARAIYTTRINKYLLCDEWLEYDNFLKWYEENVGANDWVMIIDTKKELSPDNVRVLRR